MNACGSCHKVGHNARTCPKFQDVEIKVDGRFLTDVTCLDYVDEDAPLDVVVDRLLRARGYGGLARLVAQETDLDSWAERLYELAELTDCEEVFQLCALAMRDPSHFGRLNMWAAKQLSRDQAIAQCWPVEMLLTRLTQIKE